MKLYRGVVEDNKDNEQLGRVKVRIFSIHTENNENSGEDFAFVKTSDLPWAEVLGSSTFGLVSGIGATSVLKQGTWVWVILENNDPNKPIILGTISGKNSKNSEGIYSSGLGFCDPDGIYPLTDRSTESDLNELARGVIANTIITYKNENLDTSDVYSEVAQTPSTYPNNQVIESKAGHMIELDDTEGNERVQIIDSRGNYIEMKLDEYITKAVNHKVDLIIGNLLKHTAGGVKEQVDMDYFKTIAGYFKIQADGNLEIANDVKITGGLQVTGAVAAGSNIVSGGEITDSAGNLSSLRTAYDSHSHNVINHSTTSPPVSPDPKVKAGSFVWTSSPLGFK